MEYVDQNRVALHAKYTNPSDFINCFDVKSEVLELLFYRAEKDSIARDSAQIARSMPLFLNQTKSLIARNLFDNNTFWQVANEANDSYKKALAVINTNQFDILNPSKK